jgi:general secretion pathway protein L
MGFLNIESLWRWWSRELAALVPRGDSRIAASRRASAELHAGPNNVTLHRRPRLAAPLSPPAASDATVERTAAAIRRGDRTILSLDESHCLMRRKIVPLATLGHTDRILDLDLGLATPFARSDVISGWYPDGPPPSDGRQAIVHVILRKDIVTAALARIAARGARAVAIAIRRSGGSALPLVFDTTGSPFGQREERRWLKAAAIAFGLLLAVAVGATALIFERQRRSLAALDQAIAELQAPALEVRKRIETEVAAQRQAMNLAALRSRGVAALAVWEELSRILPDTAWLQNLNIDQGAIQIEGAATAAEQLIPLLEESPVFEKARFVSPVYRNPNESKSRFSIALDTVEEKR